MNARKWAAVNSKGQHFLIKEDSKAGYYFFVYENGKCIWDDLQDTVETTKRLALQNYNVPLSAWKSVINE